MDDQGIHLGSEKFQSTEAFGTGLFRAVRIMAAAVSLVFVFKPYGERIRGGKKERRELISEGLKQDSAAK